MRYFFALMIGVSLFFVSAFLVHADSEYKVGITDVLLIDVINEPGLRASAIVGADGTISFPYLGEIYIENLSIAEVKSKIEEGLKKGFINYPVVAVSLISSKSKKVFVFGEVRGAGGFDYEDKMTVMKAISRAGGLREDGTYGKVTVRRKTSDNEYKNIPIDLKGVTEGSMTGDMLLQPNDSVVVGRNSIYFITGAVVRTGEYVLTSDMTVRNALSVAGGIRGDGQYGKINVRRKLDGNMYKDIEIDLKGLIEGAMTGDVLLHPNDTVTVEQNSTYFANGEVRRPGQYVLEDNMTVSRAIAVSGGVTPQGLFGKITVRRKSPSNIYEDLELDLNDMTEGALNGDMFLHPNDTLTVGLNKTYFVNGEVVKPGEYILKPGMTVFKALTIAGGFSKWGAPDRVKILRSYGNDDGYNTINVNIKAVTKGDASEDIILLPDDIVVAYPGLY